MKHISPKSTSSGRLRGSAGMLRRLLAWRPGGLARGTAHGTGWQAVRILLQAANVVVLAHALGARGYGALSGTVALYTILAQLVGCGTGMTLVRDMTRHPERAAVRWSATLALFVLTGLLAFAITWPAATWVLQGRLTPGTLALLASAELIAAPAVMPSAYWLLANERIGPCNGILTIPSAARLGAAVIVFAVPGATLTGYALAYAILMSATSALVIRFIRPGKDLGSTWRYQDLPALIRDGAPYILSTVSATANADIDKTLLLSFLGPLLAGQYAAAFRVAQAAAIPVNALVVALAPRLFRHGGQPDYLARSGRYLLVAMSYGLVAATLGWFMAPHAVSLLGADFGASTTMLRLLCIYIVTNCTRQVVTATLTGADQQWMRNAIEGGTMVFVVATDFMVIPIFGWKAATGIAVTGDILVIVSGLLLLRRLTAH